MLLVKFDFLTKFHELIIWRFKNEVYIKSWDRIK
jgi:hypothetical protein